MNYLRKLDIKLVEGEYKNPLKKQLRDPSQVYEIFKSLKDDAQETLLAIHLLSDLTGVYDIMSQGKITSLDIRDLYGRAYALRAEYFVLVHNHPSGNPEPSTEDKQAMEILAEQQHIAYVSFLDFVIIGQDSYWSYYESYDGGEYNLGPVE